MKNLIVLCFLICISHLSYSQIGIITNVNYGIDFDDFGFTIGADIDVKERASIAPYFTFFPQSKDDTQRYTEVKDSRYSVNADFKYDFLSKDQLSMFGLVGVSYGHLEVDLRGNFASLADRYFLISQVGANIGAGLEGALSDRTDLLFGFKYHFPFRQPEFFIGTKINL